MLAATVTYVLGVFGVTAARNVPLNDGLDAFDLPVAAPSQIEQRRSTYEQPWKRWNRVRADFGVVALGLVSAAAVVEADADG